LPLGISGESFHPVGLAAGAEIAFLAGAGPEAAYGLSPGQERPGVVVEMSDQRPIVDGVEPVGAVEEADLSARPVARLEHPHAAIGAAVIPGQHGRPAPVLLQLADVLLLFLLLQRDEPGSPLA